MVQIISTRVSWFKSYSMPGQKTLSLQLTLRLKTTDTEAGLTGVFILKKMYKILSKFFQNSAVSPSNISSELLVVYFIIYFRMSFGEFTWN